MTDMMNRKCAKRTLKCVKERWTTMTVIKLPILSIFKSKMKCMRLQLAEKIKTIKLVHQTTSKLWTVLPINTGFKRCSKW